MAAMRAIHDQVLHEHPTGAGIPFHGPRQAVAIMQRVEQVVARDGHDGVSQPVHANGVIERLALFAGNSVTDGIQVAQQPLSPHLERASLQDTVVVSRATEIVAVLKRLGQIGVLARRRLPDDMRERVAEVLHIRIATILLLQRREGLRHSLLGADRTVVLLVACERTFMVRWTPWGSGAGSDKRSWPRGRSPQSSRTTTPGSAFSKNVLGSSPIARNSPTLPVLCSRLPARTPSRGPSRICPTSTSTRTTIRCRRSCPTWCIRAPRSISGRASTRWPSAYLCTRATISKPSASACISRASGRRGWSRMPSPTR